MAKKSKAILPRPKKAAKEKREPKAKPLGKLAQKIADAEAGKIPKAPDFTAETHKRFRPRLAELEALVKAGDIKGLKAFEINPISTSPKAMDRYRNLAIAALSARARA